MVALAILARLAQGVVAHAQGRDRDIAAYVLDRVPVVLRLQHFILDNHVVGLDQLGLRV